MMHTKPGWRPSLWIRLGLKEVLMRKKLVLLVCALAATAAISLLSPPSAEAYCNGQYNIICNGRLICCPSPTACFCP
jgi:hypothetical protein